MLGSSFDDVLVEELHTGKILLSDNFNDRDHVGWTIIDEGESGRAFQWSAATGALVQTSNIGSLNLVTSDLCLVHSRKLARLPRHAEDALH